MRAASAGNRRQPERATWLGHHAWWMQIAANVTVGTYILAGLLTGNRPKTAEEQGGFWEGSMSLAGWIILGLIVFMAYLGRRAKVHDRTLCERCIAAVPLDPQRAVERKDLQLKTLHIPETHAQVRTWVVTTLSLSIGSMVLLVGTIWWQVPSVLLAAAIIWLIFIAGGLVPYLLETHRRLEPWCPYCRDDDDGFPDAIPEPSPDPQIRADR